MKSSEKIIEILEKTKEFVTDESDTVWTFYETGSDFRTEINTWIKQMKEGDTSVLSEINLAFLPASSFQDHSLQNNWTEEYLQLAAEFDCAIAKTNAGNNPQQSGNIWRIIGLLLIIIVILLLAWLGPFR